MDRDLQERVQRAVQAGANPQEAMRRASLLQQQRSSQSSVLSGDLRSGNVFQDQGLMANVANSLARPFLRTGQTVLGSGFEVVRAALNGRGGENLYATDPNTGKAKYQNPFLSQEQVENPGQVLGRQIGNSLAVASYGIPVGGATKLAGKTLQMGAFKGGALAGGLQTLGDENVTADKIALGALTGGAVGKAFDVAGKALGGIKKGGNVVEEYAANLRTGNPRLKGSAFGAADEKALKETLKEYGFKGTPEVRYQKIGPTIESIAQEVDAKLARSFKPVSPKKLEQAFMDKAKPYIRQGSITVEEAKEGFREFISNVSEISPDAFTNTRNLFALKKDVQSGMESIYKKIDAGTSLTSKEKSMKAIRDALDQVVTSAHPDVKKLTLDQSRLYDAVRPLDIARKNIPTNRILGISIPQEQANKVIDTAQAGIENVGKAAGGKLWPGVKMPAAARQALPRLSALLSTLEGKQPQEEPRVQVQGMQTTRESELQLTPEVVQAAYFVLPKAKADVIKMLYDMQNAGSGGGKKLTERQTAYKSAAEGAQYALQLLENGAASTGPGTRTSSGIRRTLGLSSKEQQDFEGTLSLARGYLLNALSGASVPPSEYQRLASLLEIEGSNPEVAKQQLRTFIRESQRFFSQNVALPYQTPQL